MGLLKTTDTYYFAVLESGSLKPGCWQDWSPLEALREHSVPIYLSASCGCWQFLVLFGLCHHLHYLFSSHIFLLSSANLFTIFANEKPKQKKWEQENNTRSFTILFCRHIWINILHEILQSCEDILQSYLWNFMFLNIFVLLQINGRSSHNFLTEYNFAFFLIRFFYYFKIKHYLLGL